MTDVKIPFVSSIAVLGLLQFMVWFASFIIVATILKTRGYPESVSHIPPDAIFAREWGLIYLLIPAAWTIWASWDFEENIESELSLKAHVVIGVMILILTSGFAIGSISVAGSTRVKTIMDRHSKAKPKPENFPPLSRKCISC